MKNSDNIQQLITSLIGKDTFTKSKLCFSKAKELTGSDKEKSLEMAIYYQDILEDNRTDLPQDIAEY